MDMTSIENKTEKRPVGRPRKIKSESEEMIEKRKVGRPKKIKQEKIKKQLGRPKLDEEERRKADENAIIKRKRECRRDGYMRMEEKIMKMMRKQSSEGVDEQYIERMDRIINEYNKWKDQKNNI